MHAFLYNSIKPGGGAYSKLDFQEGGQLIREGLIQKSAFLRGGLFELQIMFKKEAEFLPKKLSKLVVPGKYALKGRKKRLEVLQNELDKRATMLTYMKLHTGVIMQKNNSKELVIKGLSFLTESGRISVGGFSRGWAYQKIHPLKEVYSKWGAYSNYYSI